MKAKHTEELSSPSRRYVEFFTDFYAVTCRSVEIDVSATALQAMQILLEDQHDGDCTTWSVIEWKRSLCMWRLVEDHECLCELQKTWRTEIDGEYHRFVFKQGFSKYEVFRNPKQFFPAGMLNLSSEKYDMISGEHPATQNSFLRSLILSSPSWHPEFEGWLSIRDNKTWRKQFFMLRPSGLYSSTKADSKEPKYLALVCSLDTVQIYQVENGRKILGSATDSVICLSSVCDVSTRYICCEDEEMRRNWIVALRMQKCGSKLRENYLAAVQADGLLNAIENIKELALQESGKSRVAMDFSGDCGRIVEDQQEAVAALMTEIQTCKKRRSGRCHDLASASSGYPVHLSQPWYHGEMSREETIQLLSKQGLVDGVFLVRKSRSNPHAYVISYNFSGKVKHHQVAHIKSNDQICLTLDEGKTKFADLNQLVEFYQLNTGVLPTKLTYALKVAESPKR